MPNKELNKTIRLTSDANKALNNYPHVLFKTLIKMNDEVYSSNFITKVKYTDEYAELNVWSSKFKINWDLKAKTDINNIISEYNYFLEFTIFKSTYKDDYVDNFIITYDKQIKYGKEDGLCLDCENDILKLFCLIFEKYFNRNVKETDIDYINL